MLKQLFSFCYSRSYLIQIFYGIFLFYTSQFLNNIYLFLIYFEFVEFYTRDTEINKIELIVLRSSNILDASYTYSINKQYYKLD